LSDTVDAAKLEKLKALVDEYVEKVLTDQHVDDDTDHYIFEAAVELFYGRLIWNQLNEHL